MNRLDIEGLVAAAFSPLSPRGDLLPEQIRPLTDYLLSQEISGLYVCGSTGEGPLLTTSERMETAAAYTRAAAGRIPVIVQVGHSSIRESQALAAHAERIGADAISCTPPLYFKPRRVENLVACLAEIATAAPSLPLYYYHIPALTDVSPDMVALLRMADGRLPTLGGVKFSCRDLDVYQRLLQFDGGRYEILFGVDEMLLSALAVGGRSAVGSTYNFAAPLYRQLWRAFDSGDLPAARRGQMRAVELIELLIGYGGQPAFKSMMRLLGFDCGPSRLPLESLDEADSLRLLGDLVAAGFMDQLALDTPAAAEKIELHSPGQTGD